MLAECPCRDCAKRQIGCHAKCSSYGEWKACNDELRYQRHKASYNAHISYTGKPKRKR